MPRGRSWFLLKDQSRFLISILLGSILTVEMTRPSPDHVDEIRRDEDVAAELGTAISDQLVRQNPNLVAIRPLVESVATRVAGGDLLSGPTRTAEAYLMIHILGDTAMNEAESA